MDLVSTSKIRIPHGIEFYPQFLSWDYGLNKPNTWKRKLSGIGFI